MWPVWSVTYVTGSTAVWAAIEVRQHGFDLQAIESILIETSEFNKRVLADPEKWCPKTRETADHSLPYNVVRALIDGDICLESYSAERIGDPKALALMQRVVVQEDPQLTALFPRHLANRVSVTLVDGTSFSSEVISGPGSVETPMTGADFSAKFRRMAAAHISSQSQEQVLAFVSDLESATGYQQLFEAMACNPSANA